MNKKSLWSTEGICVLIMTKACNNDKTVKVKMRVLCHIAIGALLKLSRTDMHLASYMVDLFVMLTSYFDLVSDISRRPTINQCP